MRICVTRTNRDAYSETFLVNQKKELSKYATVYSIYGGTLPEHEENGKLLNPLPFWIMHKLLKTLFKKENSFFAYYGLKRFLRKNKIDVVLVNYGPAGAKIIPVCKALNIPMVVHFHGFDASHQLTLKKYENGYNRLFKCAAAIVVVSTDMKKQLISLNASEKKIFTIPYGIDIKKFTPCNPEWNEKIFIAVGRFAPKKAPQLTIQAFAQVVKEIPEARLIMAGSKEEMFLECEELVKNLQLNNCITFTGSKSPEEVSKLLHAARVFVQHSVVASDGDSEGTPNSILEASASGLPIVSTFHAGIKEAVIHGKTGFLVPEKDVNGMAHYMKFFIQNPGLAKEMGQNGRQHIEQHYLLNTQIKKLFTILKDAVNK